MLVVFKITLLHGALNKSLLYFTNNMFNKMGTIIVYGLMPHSKKDTQKYFAASKQQSVNA